MTFADWWKSVEGWKTEGGSGESKARAAWNAAIESTNQELEMTADKLSDCWLFLDRLAHGGSYAITEVTALLRKQECPGWKAGK